MSGSTRRRLLPARLVVALASVAAALAPDAAPRPGVPSPPAAVTVEERGLRLPARLPDRRIAVPILMYHRVNRVGASTPPIERRLTVSPRDFARQMAWLDRHGYHTVTQRRLFEALGFGRRLPRKSVAITLDDGYVDVLRHASPVLRRLRMRATAYVISGRIANGYPLFLAWHHLRALERRGIEIGSHGVTHRDLTSLGRRDAFLELARSRRTLERGLKHPVQWFAYPHGGHSPRLARLARRAGYVLAVTTEHGAVHSARSPLALRRLQVLDSTGVRGLAALLGERP